MAINRYYCVDDYANTNTLGVNTGGASSQVVVAPFVAPTIASAMQVAYVLSTALQRPLRLVPEFTPPPYTLVTGILPTVALTSIPSGITY
jgi:hypothetical protein